MLAIFLVIGFLSNCRSGPIEYCGSRSDGECSLESEIPETLQDFIKDFYVIAPIFNPSSYKSRYQLYYQFEEYILKYKLNLITIELIYTKDNGKFSVTSPDNPNHIQIKTDHPLWHRENMFNIAAERLPPNWKYIVYIDADTAYAEEDWVERMYEAFQKYEIVHLFKVLQHLGPKGEVFENHLSLGWSLIEEVPINSLTGRFFYPFSGAGWGYTRKAFERLGGLIDFSVVGHADSLMTDGFLRIDSWPSLKDYHPNFKILVDKWQERSIPYIEAHKIGYANLTIKHFWHGDTAHRAYSSRIKSLLEEGYDPIADSFYDGDGVLQLRKHKKSLIEKVEKYFSSRKEDDKSPPLPVFWVRTAQDIERDIDILRELSSCVPKQ